MNLNQLPKNRRRVVATAQESSKATDPEELNQLRDRWRENLPLNLQDFAVALGIGYATAKRWKAMGMPTLSGRVFREDFERWKAGVMEKQAGKSGV